MKDFFPHSLVIILDEDWAPDFVIEDVKSLLESNQIKSTWFITHRSDILNDFKKDSELFELGIHPNFLPNSTHGQTTQAVMEHCLDILPDTKSMRAHAYAQSSLLYSFVATHTSIAIDASIFIPHADHLAPFQYWIGNRSIYRTPVFWEDDNEMKIPGFRWDVDQIDLLKPGLKIFAFHPIHIYLNTSTMAQYINMKNKIFDINGVNKTELDYFIQKDKRGGRDFFLDLVKIISEQKESFLISEIIPTTEGSLHEK